MLARTVLLQMARNKKLESFARRNSWSARVSGRFVAGETVEDAIAPVQAINAQGATASLDFLGESVSNEVEIAVTMDAYLRLFQQIRENNLDAAVSVKLTALGLEIDDDLCYRNMTRLLKAAGPDRFVQVDMEGSALTQRTLDIVFRLWDGPEPFRNVGAVVQAYLYRTADDIEKLIDAGIRVRLCKGAYKEGSDVAFPSKADVDANYSKLMKRLLDAGTYPGIATHDAALIAEAKTYAKENNIGPERFEFQMLYGIRRDLQTEILREGWNLTIYTPFGTHWYPYFMRRLAERPANIWFIAKNMFRK